jgi:hypothetical protein
MSFVLDSFEGFAALKTLEWRVFEKAARKFRRRTL